MHAVEIVPTVVPSVLSDVETRVVSCAQFSSTIHIDIADGVFAPNITWMPQKGERLPNADNTLYETHLMVLNPTETGEVCVSAGARRIIAHVESFSDSESARHACSLWRASGVSEIGLGVLMATPVEQLEPCIGMFDFLHMMTIATIGTQGIPYDESSPTRVATLHNRYPHVLISVDGGISEHNIAELVHVGARRFCIGSALTNAQNPKQVYENLKSLAESAIE